jgi:hypothetical protein
MFLEPTHLRLSTLPMLLYPQPPHSSKVVQGPKRQPPQMPSMRNSTVTIIQVIPIKYRITQHQRPQRHGDNPIKGKLCFGIQERGYRPNAHDAPTEPQRPPLIIPVLHRGDYPPHAPREPGPKDQDSKLERRKPRGRRQHLPHEEERQHVAGDVHDVEVGEDARDDGPVAVLPHEADGAERHVLHELVEGWSVALAGLLCDVLVVSEDAGVEAHYAVD